jgi:hypothetical protein
MREITSPTSFLAVGLPVVALAGGSWIFLGFLVFAFFGVVVGYYTEKGSGITARPYGKIYGGAPGAFGPGEVSGRDSREHADWSRGTR